MKCWWDKLRGSLKIKVERRQQEQVLGDGLGRKGGKVRELAGKFCQEAKHEGGIRKKTKQGRGPLLVLKSKGGVRGEGKI